MPSAVFELSDRYVSELASLDPMAALELGLPLARLGDFSSAGVGKVADLNRRTLAELAQLADASPRDAVARRVLNERLAVAIDSFDAGDHLVDLNNLFCPLQQLRQAFEILPNQTAEQQRNWVSCAADLPRALSSWRSALAEGLAKGRTAARRQALQAAAEARTYAKDDFIAKRLPDFGGDLAIADAVAASLVSLADWLESEYAPRAQVTEGVGEARYLRGIRRWNGIAVDPHELFQWGWQELGRITTRMESVRDRIAPAASVAELPEILDQDPKYRIVGEAEIVKYLTGVTEQAVIDMSEHFDIAPEIRRCGVAIAPAGSASAAYYIPPSEDLSRIGTTWLPNVSGGVFHTWHLLSTWYHEGVPGHHMQFAITVLMREHLSRYQRTLGWISGYGEGWALYAERLMDELGYFKDPGYELGFLSSQALRAARIIVDIGMHLGLSVPADVPGEVAGTAIDYDFSVDFLQRRALLPAVEAESETIRYLGMPAQAISYKLGERTILELREAARARLGAEFDLKAWHSWLLGIGPVGLATLQELAAAEAG